ncbi:MAG TPA: hypothetical protein HPQ04_07690 [Rhodospirillaceae bacterium]|nr:hypothetical protein [Rhodospirillaceae bacterium]
MSIALNLQTVATSAHNTLCRTQFMIDATDIRPDDRVVVIGQGSLEYLLGLVRAGCRSAVAIRSQALCRFEEVTADVIWFTGVVAFDADFTSTFDHREVPRVVAIELMQDCTKARLSEILGQLRSRGLVDQSVRKVAGRTVMVASRPTWLRRVI